ncbi:MAG: hypothetical protein KGH55_01455 [Nanoarchaeota archaeon]|nr:hypothetical protein [Nanoarchaeota archaeon]
MNQKESYTPNEVAQIVAAYQRIHAYATTTGKEVGLYEQFVPNNVRISIDRLMEAQNQFYGRAQRHNQVESIRELEGRVSAYQDFEEFLHLHGMLK